MPSQVPRPPIRKRKLLLLPAKVIGAFAVVMAGFGWQIIRDTAIYKGWYTPRSEE